MVISITTMKVKKTKFLKEYIYEKKMVRLNYMN